MTDLSKFQVAHLLGQWQEIVGNHSCIDVEIQLDTAIRAARDLAAQLGKRDAALDGARLTIASQCLRIAALEAQAKRLREGGPLTRSERIVGALQALRQADYSP